MDVSQGTVVALLNMACSPCHRTAEVKQRQDDKNKVCVRLRQWYQFAVVMVSDVLCSPCRPVGQGQRESVGLEVQG